MFLSDVEAKHLQLSVDQVEKTSTDYIRSAQALVTLAANSGETDKCSSTNTSLNSSSSSTSNRNLSNKILKTNRSIKQRKSSPKSLTKTELLTSPNIIDDYPSSSTTTTATSAAAAAAAGLGYTHDDIYYNSQTNYPNFSLYTSSTNYPNSSCFSTYSNIDDDNKTYSSLPMYNSMYYDQQQQQQQSNDYHLLSTTKINPLKQQSQQQSMINKKKQQILPIQTQQHQQQQQQHIKRGPSCETLSLCDVNNKRVRLDNDPHHHHHLSHIDYQTNLPSDKIDFYPPTNNCYASTNYPTEHPYHHTSVIVDSQQYFLNGWNGTTAF